MSEWLNVVDFSYTLVDHINDTGAFAAVRAFTGDVAGTRPASVDGYVADLVGSDACCFPPIRSRCSRACRQ